MKQKNSYSFEHSYRLYDLQGIFGPSAKAAERLISRCLGKSGSSGYLGSGAVCAYRVKIDC